MEIWRGLNLAIRLHRGRDSFGADKLYLECSVKFPKNMHSSPIELYGKTPPFRRCVHYLTIPYLFTFLVPQQALAVVPHRAAIRHSLMLYTKVQATILSCHAAPRY